MADQVPAFDDIPSFDDMPDAQQQNAAPAQSAGSSGQPPLMFDDIPAFDDMPTQPAAKPTGEGTAASALRGGASAVGGAAGAYYGAGLGAEAGAMVAPFLGPAAPAAPFVGGLIGGAIGAFTGNEAEQGGKEALGIDDSMQLAADAEAHPYATFGGQLAASMAGMNPTATVSTGARLAGAALGGGMEIGQEYANDGKFDPTKIALSALAFGTAPSTNKLGATLEGAGTATARKFVPGRPNMAPNPAADQAKVDVGSQHIETTAAGGVADQLPPQRNDSSIGNPQSSPTNSRGDVATGRPDATYAKGAAPEDYQNDMLTQGDMDPATRAALAGEDEGIEAAASPLAQQPQPASEPGPPAPSTADVASRLQTKPQPAENAPELASPAQVPEGTGPEPKNVSEPQQSELPAFDDIPEAPAAPQIATGFPQVGEPLAVGANEATPMPKRAAAIEVSKANANKPRLGLKQPSEGKPDLSSGPNAEPIGSGVTGKTNKNPTDAQKEAGNYEKARERMLGHEVAYENLKGSERSGVGANGEKWTSQVPADYGYFRNTVGADKDHVDLYNLRNGDQHFIVDQRNPDTGKFDEHKVIMNARDLNDARDTYLKGFSDNSGLSRLHDITQVDEPALQGWLKSASKKKPYGAPVKAPKPEPKVATTAIDRLRAAGMNDAADAIATLAPDQRVDAANKALRMMTNKTGTLKTGELKNARVRQAAPIVEGAEGVTAKSKTDAANKSAALKAARDIFDEHAPPATDESKEQTVERARRATIKAATIDKYPFKMQVKQEPAMWLAAAKGVSKKPSDAKVAEFLATEKLLRSGNKEDIALVRQGNRTEADIGKSRRSGEAAITGAENNQARFDIPHEEAEEWVPPRKVETREDLAPKGTRTLDMENPEHRASLAKLMNKDVEPTPKWKEIRDAQRKKTADDAARQVAERQAAAVTGDAKAIPPKSVKDMSQAEKEAYVAKLNDAMKKGKGLDALPAERTAKGGVRDLLGDYISNEDGSLNQGKIAVDLKKLAGSATRKFAQLKLGRDYSKEPRAYHSQKIDTPEKEYNNSLSDDLHTIDTQNASHEQGLYQWAKAGHKDIDPALREKLYFAHEEGRLGTLTADERAAYDKWVKPILDENEGLKTLIQAIDPDRIGPDVANHMYHVVKGVQGQDPLKPGVLRDPLGARNNISQRARGTMLERGFMALEHPNGKRFVIQPNDKGFLLWDHGKARQIKDPTFEFEAGKVLDVAGHPWTMNDALTREIERNARDQNGKMMKYHHDAVMSSVLANQQLAEVARHMTYIQEIKNNPGFQARSTLNGTLAAEKGWEHPKLPEFEKYWVDPMLKAVMDDYAKPGFDAGRSVDWARQLSQGITKTIFWNPVIHPLNVAGHWFVGRGWDNLDVKSLLKTAGPAFKDVLTQGPIQREIQHAGGSVMYGQTLTRNFTKAVGTALGHEIEQEPASWDPIARKFGMGPSDLIKSIYDGSQKIMWAANDMMYTQHYLEFRNKGMSPEGAVRAVEKDIPNYRLTPTLAFGQGRLAHLSRFTSQMMADPLATSFGRYHAGIWNAYANMVHGMIDKDATKTERFDAVGKLFALGALMFVAKPLADKFAQTVSGNHHASEIPRGPLTIPADLARAGRGEDDIASAARATVTLSPMVSMLLQLLHNKDFADRSIFEPGDVRNAVHGSPVAAAKVGAQGAEFVARNTVAPLNVAENEEKKPNGSVVGGLRDQLLGIKNPSPKAAKYEATAPRKAEQNAVTRQRQGGRGFLEEAVDKLGFK